MRDPLFKYLKSNRNKLDTYVPDSSNWEAIEKRIRKRKQKTRFLWIASSAAAILLVFFVFRDNSVVGVDSEWDNSPKLDASVESPNDRALISWDSPQSVQFERSKQRKSHGTTELIFKDLNANTYTYSVANVAATTTSMNYSLDTDNSNSPYAPIGNVNSNPTPPPSPPRVVYDVDHYYEQYDKFKENAFESPLNKPLSTFGIDVDGAGYSNVRRFINSRFLPPKDAVKLEEMINYFNYDLPEPTGNDPFSITTEVGECPWEKDNLLMQVALKGKSIDFKETQSNNLVFLIDVSGSMSEADKLPLLKKSIKLVVKEMDSEDKIAIVVYAGAAGLALPSISGKYKETIYEAIEGLNAGGSTAGGAGIELAYKVAQDEFIKTGNNRIILATDGDFNVGASSDDALVKLIERKRETGVYLSVIGFGTGNLQSSKMEKLANNGNGNYSYIDNILEAKKVLVNEIGGTLVTIAKDVKLQVEFNQDYVKSYRLLGYENRILETKDFDDDTKDSGDLGSGHTIVALYELVKQDKKKPELAGNLRYQRQELNNSNGVKDELAHIKFRYKKPNSSRSILLKKTVGNTVLEENSDNFLFAAAVAEYGLLIRESKYRSNASFNKVIARASRSRGNDKYGYRVEFIAMVEASRKLMQEYYVSANYKMR
jgi:Ca-activated chloride channel family protein